MTGERVDPVVPLDPDRLDAIQAAAQEANGDGVTWKLADPERPDGHEVLVDYDNGDEGASVLHDRYLLRADAVHIATADPPTVLALVAAARERDDLWTDIHGCQCPAPYDQCPHDEPFLLIEKRLRVECDALRADAARLAAFHEEQHRSLTSHAAELTVERDALRAEVERLTAEIRRMRND